MSLHAIVVALGGELYHGGARANVPGPGHSADDRSVSLWLTQGRVLIHSFGGSDWRDVREDLRRRGLVDSDCRPIGSRTLCPVSAAHPDRIVRRQTAEKLWSEGVNTGAAGLLARHLRRRGLRWSSALRDLLEHPAAPVSAYRSLSPTMHALMARISDRDGNTAGVELTYLDLAGRRADHLTISRKAVGCIPRGSAVRLCSVRERMLVGEGVITTLSAMRRFGFPGWALLSATNLANWSPPPGVLKVLIAADRGKVGENAAWRLRRRLEILGVETTIRLPPTNAGDWNDALVADKRRMKRDDALGREGGEERPSR